MHEQQDEIVESFENCEAPVAETALLIESFRKYRMSSAPNKIPTNGKKPASDLNGKEILHIRRVLEKNKGIRHQTADELDCSISWLDQVIAFHKLEK